MYRAGGGRDIEVALEHISGLSPHFVMRVDREYDPPPRATLLDANNNKIYPSTISVEASFALFICCME